MKKTTVLKIASGGVLLLIGGTVYGNVVRKQREKTASALLLELTKELQPATKGLLNEIAFDVKFSEKVLDTVRGRIQVLSETEAFDYADQIHQTFKPWYYGGNDTEKLYGIFRKLSDKVAVSQVAKAYETNQNKNLIDTLNAELSEDTKKILEIVKPLDKYTIRA